MRPMRKYLIAYGAWLAFVALAAGVALAWYQHVERIGLQELAERLRDGTGTDSEPDR